MRSLILAAFLGLGLLGAVLWRAPDLTLASPAGRVALPAVSAAATGDCAGMTRREALLQDNYKDVHTILWTSALGNVAPVRQGMIVTVLANYLMPVDAGRRSIAMGSRWYNPAGTEVQTLSSQEPTFGGPGGTLPYIASLPASLLTTGSWRVDVTCGGAVVDSIGFTVAN